MTKVVLVGANHAGIAAVNTIMAADPEAEITIIDANTNLSYLGCGTALWVGRQIDTYEGLFYTNKEAFLKAGCDVKMKTRVDRVDYAKKVVYAHGADGSTYEVPYDKLILATGSIAIKPSIPGIDLGNIQTVKLFQDGQKCDEALADTEVKKVAVVGAGYIGVELAEAVHRRGKECVLIDSAQSCLSTYYDKWFTDDMTQNLKEHGIDCHFGETVQSFGGENGKVTSVTTDKNTYDADLVLVAVGFTPNNDLGKDHLELFANGAYVVDEHQKTSDPDVYAIGDCATIYSNALQKTTYIALATNAVRTGIVAGYNVAGTELAGIGVQGSNGISIFDYHMVSTGLNTEVAEKAGFEPEHADFEDNQRPEFMPKNNKVKVRIVFDKSTRRILGAQMASFEDISMGIHMFSLAIQEGFTIDKLKLLDIFFLPHFNKPYNYITMAALSV